MRIKMRPSLSQEADARQTMLRRLAHGHLDAMRYLASEYWKKYPADLPTGMGVFGWCLDCGEMWCYECGQHWSECPCPEWDGDTADE